MANTKQRIQRARQSVTDEGVLTVHIYSPIRDDDGNQKVVASRPFNVAELPIKQQALMCAKGVGAFMAQAYGTLDDPDPNDVAEACTDLWDDMVKGTFTPGRGAGEGRPTAFFEALAEFLKLPVHVVMHQVREDKTTFSAGKLAQFAKHPPIAEITARIEGERAKEKLAKAKAAKKTAGEMDIASLFNMDHSGAEEADGEEEEEAA